MLFNKSTITTANSFSMRLVWQWPHTNIYRSSDCNRRCRVV